MSIQIILYVILFYTYYGLLSLLFLQICLTYSYIFPLHVYMHHFLSLSFPPLSLSFPFPSLFLPHHTYTHVRSYTHSFLFLSYLLTLHHSPLVIHSLIHSFVHYTVTYTHTHTNISKELQNKSIKSNNSHNLLHAKTTHQQS